MTGLGTGSFGVHMFGLPVLRRACYRLLLCGLMLTGAVFSADHAWAKRSNAELSEAAFYATVNLASLPQQGQLVYGLILQGGPFAYDKDGTTFGNRERLLPAQKRGYYREYTVKTPGSRDRGARRIICGGEAQRPESCFYTDDHYSSFRKIMP
jgi:ribonuclease T1